MNDQFQSRLDHRLRDLSARHLRRHLRPLSSPVAACAAGEVLLDGRRMLNFSGNDYLGLSRHPALIARAADVAAEYGVGATASRLVCGSLELHHSIETRLAALKSTEAALLMNAGYQANQSALAALLAEDLVGPEPQVFADRLCHASMYDGFRSSPHARLHRFHHNDLDHLESLLQRVARGPLAERQRMIVVESVYSMDGDRADLLGLCALAERYQAVLYVDEAHATGILGPEGRGLTADVAGRVDVIMGTCGKALGSFGAYLSGSAAVCDYLVNRCGGLIYSTALPPPVLGAIDAALTLLPTPELDHARATVAAHAAFLRHRLSEAGLDCGPSSTQIVPVILGDAARTLAMAQHLEANGILAVAIRPPTVPPHSARLRLTLSAAHTRAEVERLADLIVGGPFA